MTGKELYEKYAGRKASCEGFKGVVCGYNTYDNDDRPLILRVSGNCGWSFIGDDDVIDTSDLSEDDYCSFWYVSEEDIID